MKSRIDIDVLSLSATPIPRTLNSTLSQIKDMSVINTPPIGRKNINTTIIKLEKEVLKSYFDREINRGGQVLYVHNNIESMDDQIKYLMSICSDYKIEKIHGKQASSVEKIMLKFLDNEIDMLVVQAS